MSTSDQLSNTFLGYLNLDMSNHSYPPFPDLYDYITSPSPSVSYTLPMMPTPISSRLAPPPTPILAPQTVPDPLSPPPFPPPLVLSFRKPDGNFYWQCRDKKQNTPAFNQLQLKQFRIISDYHSNEVLRIHLRCLYGLPFIPLTDVIDAWTGDSVQWGFRPVGIPGTYRRQSLYWRLIQSKTANPVRVKLQNCKYYIWQSYLYLMDFAVSTSLHLLFLSIHSSAFKKFTEQ